MFVEVTNRMRQAKNEESLCENIKQNAEMLQKLPWKPERKTLDSIILDIEIMALFHSLSIVLHKYCSWDLSLQSKGEKIKKVHEYCNQQMKIFSEKIILLQLQVPKTQEQEVVTKKVQVVVTSEVKRDICFMCEELEEFIENLSWYINNRTN